MASLELKDNVKDLTLVTGDLSLLGHPLRAHVVAYRAGHDLHARLARTIWQTKDAWYLAPWSGRSDGSESAPT